MTGCSVAVQHSVHQLQLQPPPQPVGVQGQVVCLGLPGQGQAQLGYVGGLKRKSSIMVHQWE